MKPSKRVTKIILLTISLLAGGCYGTYNTTRKSELDNSKGVGPIRALTLDSLLYTFDTFSQTDTALFGKGTVKMQDTILPFEGSVRFDRIVFIERREISFWKGLWVIPAMFAMASRLPATLPRSSEFEIHRITGSSCPYVYSYDGAQFRLEAEAFGTSVSKAFEAQTFSVLPTLTPVGGRAMVRISNERPETHLLNSVHLYAADAEERKQVVLDVNNVLWPLPALQPPSTAHEYAGKDIRTEIKEKDGVYWKSDLTHTTASAGFRDNLELQFELPARANEATLVISAVNSDLINEVYRSMGSVLGDATLEFYHALENDVELQRTIRDWVGEASLRVDVGNGTEWRNIGAISPEASVAPFSRAIRIRNIRSNGSPLSVRLSALTDLWRIDAVSIDCSPVDPLPMHPLNLLAVNASDSADWKSAVTSSDSSYALILPPNHLDLTFDTAPVRGMRCPVYVFAAQGYLYEWFAAQPSSFATTESLPVSGFDRVALVKLLIQHRDVFLPPIYAAWKNERDMNNRR